MANGCSASAPRSPCRPATGPACSPRYIADPPEQRRAIELDGLTAFYHRPSGMTHILAPPAPQILEALSSGSADTGELLARIGARFEVEGGEEALAARLAELEAAGLVTRA